MQGALNLGKSQLYTSSHILPYRHFQKFVLALLMYAIDPSDEDIVDTVLSIEGDLVEEGRVMPSEEADLTGEADVKTADVGVIPTGCRVANQCPSFSSETFNSLLEAVLTDEFRK